MKMKKYIFIFSVLALTTLTSYTSQDPLSQYFAVQRRSIEQIEKDMQQAQSALKIMYMDPMVANLLHQVDQLDTQSKQYTQTRNELLEKIGRLRQTGVQNDELNELIKKHKEQFSHNDIPAEKQKREFILQWNQTQTQKDPKQTWGPHINAWQVLLNKEKIVQEINALKSQYWHAQMLKKEEQLNTEKRNFELSIETAQNIQRQAQQEAGQLLDQYLQCIQKQKVTEKSKK